MRSEKVWPSAYIVRDFADVPSNFRCQGTLDAMLKAHGVVGMYDLDTRRLTKTLRESGTMNAVILPALTNIPEEIEKLHQIEARAAGTKGHLQRAENTGTKTRAASASSYGISA